MAIEVYTLTTATATLTHAPALMSMALGSCTVTDGQRYLNCPGTHLTSPQPSTLPSPTN
jgi:hypothetical protein